MQSTIARAVGGLAALISSAPLQGDNVASATDAVGSCSVGNAFTPNLTVDYGMRDIATNASVLNSLDFWDANYGGLSNVALAPAFWGQYAELIIVAEPGWAGRLDSFDVARYPQVDRPDSRLRIVDANTDAALVNLGP